MRRNHIAAAGIRSQKLKYANALASLPKQVLRDILDTMDMCNDSDEPFDHLKNTFLGQFGKSKWQVASGTKNTASSCFCNRGECIDYYGHSS
jgi:hypothetical protein